MRERVEKAKEQAQKLPKQALEAAKKGVELTKQAVKGVIELVKKLKKKELAPLMGSILSFLNPFGKKESKESPDSEPEVHRQLDYLRREIEHSEKKEFYKVTDLPSALERLAAINAAGKFEQFQAEYIDTKPQDAVRWEIEWMAKHRVPKATAAQIQALANERISQESEKVQERFAKLNKERGQEVAFYARQIYANYSLPLTMKKAYKEKTLIAGFDGRRAKWMTNSCVGFVMSALSRLPFKIPERAKAAQNAGRYLSTYDWTGLDGHKYIEDIWGHELPREYTVTEPSPNDIDGEPAFKNLAVGEYAVASIEMHHVFLIYKNIDGKIIMVHSGRDLSGKGKYTGSRVNEVPLSHYLENTPDAKGKSVTFAPLSKMVEIADKTKNADVRRFYEQNEVSA